ncbi:hypothetical protein BRC81_03005 [Halobacteriales archaeon QS_1_68_20]|nr:MAG: hypothetical protein BRC81_03005 [Halobacteriales archaeon QS_1_68_20]
MSIFDSAVDEAAERMTSTSSGSDNDDRSSGVGATTASLQGREATVEVAGEQVPVQEPDTVKTDEDGTWLTGGGRYGRPRGREALQARQIVETSAMQAIGNGIVDQLLGGELAFESDDDDPDSAEAELQALLREVLTGPHLGDVDLDDLLTAAVFDMLGPGNAYWQLHPPAEDSGVDLPVVALSSLDALTIRHNTDRNGVPRDPPYYQAQGAFTSDGAGTLGNVDPTPLERDQLAVMHYPRGHRSNSFYPTSPALQVKEWLEILANSTTHHNRFYSDNEIPPGLIQIMQGSEQTVENVKEKIQAASGDPRDVPVIGGEGGAQWLDLGGTAVNLNIIEEQRWFFQMCLASLGLGKQELGFIEDVNRSNGEVESSRIYKRITGPFAKKFEQAFTHVARQFDVYTALEEPFRIKLRFTDPREERAREQRLREMYEAGGLTLREYVRRRGDEDLADNEMTVTIGDEEIPYGDLPKHVLEHKLRAARADADAEADMNGSSSEPSATERPADDHGDDYDVTDSDEDDAQYGPHNGRCEEADEEVNLIVHVN